MSVKQPVMVITGTSKGIGYGMAKHFLAQGSSVAGCSRGVATIEHDNYSHSPVDIGNEDQVRGWIRAVKKQFGRIDILVCNAGVAPANLLMAMTSGAVLIDLLRVNIAGSCRSSRRRHFGLLCLKISRCRDDENHGKRARACRHYL